MTEGPYADSIRGEGPGGIRWLWNNLATALAGLSNLTQIAADIALIRADIAKLVGSAAAPTGYVGAPTALADLRARLTILSGTATNPSGFGNAGLPAYLTTALHTRLDLGNGDVSIYELLVTLTNAQFGPGQISVGDTSAAAASVLGTIGAAPVGSTIKDLLRSMDVNVLRSADCCEDNAGGGGDPDNPLNQPPTGFGCANAQRVAGWHAISTRTSPTQQQFTTWQALFNTPPGMAAVNGNPDLTRRGFHLADPQPTKYDICITWDFTGNAMIPNEFGRDKSSSPSIVNSNVTGAPPLGGTSTLTKGGLTDELSRCVANDPADDYVVYNFEFAGGAVPPLNAFLGSIVRNCAV